MNDLKPCLLIGGPRDGFRIGLTEKGIAGFNSLYVPIPAPLPVAHIENLSPEGPEIKRSVYLPERLRGENIEVVFYRHEELPLDEALMKLFERYPQESAENSR